MSIFCGLTLFAPGAFAQYTQVSGTILDPQGVPYSAATIKAQIVLPLNFTGQPTVPNNSQSSCIASGLGNAPCRVAFDGTHGPVPLRSQGASDDGHFVLQVEDTSQVLPASSQWLFTVSISPGCVEPWGFGPRSFTYQTTITGASVDLSTPLSAIAPLLCRRVTASGITGVNWFLSNALVGVEPGYDVERGSNITITATDDPGASRVHYTINATGAGSGCTLSGIDTGVLSEHPLGTCFDSFKFTWDATNEIMLAGNGASTITGVGSTAIFSFGNTDELSGPDIYNMGSSNISKGTGVVSLGGLSTYNTTGNGVLQSSVLAEFNGEIDLVNANTRVVDAEMLGSDDQITIGSPSSGFNETNCIHGVGGHNLLSIAAGSAGASISIVSWVGKNNAFISTGGFDIQDVVIAGNDSEVSTALSRVETGGMFGNSLALDSCLNCYAVGESVSNFHSDTLQLGMSQAAEIEIAPNRVTFKHLPFLSLPACVAGTEGSLMAVTDSTTNTWGATITGGSTNHVLGYCDGTSWTVAGK